MKLLQFKAHWCHPCKQQTKEFEENPVDTELVPIDVDEDKEDLATKYNVRAVPTMVLVGDNDEVLNKWVGITKSSTINEFITKKELMAIMPLLSVISSVASEIDYYSVDYDVKDLGHLADKLREAAATFRKEAKI